MVEPQTPLGVLHKFTSYIYKVFLHLDMLCIGIWHHPQPDTPISLRSILRNVRLLGTDLFDKVTSWLSPKPHLECFTNQYYIYIEYFCTLISCGLVIWPHPQPGTPLSLCSIFRNVGVGTDLFDEVTSWLSPQTPLGVLYKFTSYIYKVFLQLHKLWIGNMGPSLPTYLMWLHHDS